MHGQPPPLRKQRFGFFDWAAFACLAAMPAAGMLSRLALAVSVGFPDVMAVRTATSAFRAHVNEVFIVIAIVCGAVSLLGMRRGHRLRIGLMTGLGLLMTALVMKGVRF